MIAKKSRNSSDTLNIPKKINAEGAERQRMEKAWIDTRIG